MVLCPECKFENRDSANFCLNCGTALERKCVQCGHIIPSQANFCDHCGKSVADILIRGNIPSLSATEGERKFVTALFCDLSGYTLLSGRLDPEELKELMTGILGESARVIVKYGGFVEKSIGDATMALFGAIEAHEDDPVRAIRAAMEIHEAIRTSSILAGKAGQPVAMHTGINTGLVVTGEVSLKDGTHGVLGDTINVAARLVGLAKMDQIVVGPETYRQAEGYFDFEKLEPATVKGKTEPLQLYRVLQARQEPIKTHRHAELNSELIGRDAEMALLAQAVEYLKRGTVSVISIIGDVGTGKSRLVEEFKSSLADGDVRWFEGHCYAYTQNTPYYPLTNLLSRAWHIKEGDLLEKIKERVELSARSLVGNNEDIIRFVAGLYSIQYPEFGQVSPEAWKAGLHGAVHELIAGLCRLGPAVICVEDLHWSDPSSLELLRGILFNQRNPALFLCVYRPAPNLFPQEQTREIILKDLSPEDSQRMVESILRSKSIPAELRNFIHGKVEGNPFYLKEVIFSLLDTDVLVNRGGIWALNKPIEPESIPPNVQGLISARLDRLGPAAKKVLQEASVIGRSFMYDILKRTTDLKDKVDSSLAALERLDLVQPKAGATDREYIFKHVITQEVVYSGLLKKDRQKMHEKIGRVMEDVFQQRLPDFYESLAFHYNQAQSSRKAVEYLVKSAGKSLARYALDEAHQHYREAFEILKGISGRSRAETEFLVDVLLEWAVIFYRRCHFFELIDLLKSHESLVVFLGDEERTGMFYARLGAALNWSNNMTEALSYLTRALETGERTGSEKVISSAYTFLPWCYNDLGMLDEAVECGRKAQELAMYKTDPDFFRHVSFYIGFARYFRGDVVESRETGELIIDFANRHSRRECLSDGYLCLTFSDLVAGDFPSAIDNIKKSYRFALDPLIKITATTLLGMTYVSAGKYQEAKKILDELTVMTGSCHSFPHGTVAKLYTGIITVINGDLKRGITMIEEVSREYLDSKLKYRYAVCNHLLGQIYSQLVPGAEGGTKISFSFIVKNFGFLIKTVPSAFRKAKFHFLKAVEVSDEIGAMSILGQAWYDLGYLYGSRGQLQKGRDCIEKSIAVFEKCKAGPFLNRAKESLASFK
ncbi:MAG: adenylate/guanylate cyclase domain-containing protein [Syntrophaceae bacterium]